MYLSEIKKLLPTLQTVVFQLENDTFQSPKETKHTHEGSINNLCLEEIKEKMNSSY